MTSDAEVRANLTIQSNADTVAAGVKALTDDLMRMQQLAATSFQKAGALPTMFNPDTLAKSNEQVAKATKMQKDLATATSPKAAAQGVNVEQYQAIIDTTKKVSDSYVAMGKAGSYSLKDTTKMMQQLNAVSTMPGFDALTKRVPAFGNAIKSTQDSLQGFVSNLAQAQNAGTKLPKSIDAITKAQGTSAKSTKGAGTALLQLQQQQQKMNGGWMTGIERTQGQAKALNMLSGAAAGSMLSYGILNGKLTQVGFGLIFMKFNIVGVAAAFTVLASAITMYIRALKQAFTQANAFQDAIVKLKGATSETTQAATKEWLWAAMSATTYGFVIGDVVNALGDLATAGLHQESWMKAVEAIAAGQGITVQAAAQKFAAAVGTQQGSLSAYADAIGDVNALNQKNFEASAQYPTVMDRVARGNLVAAAAMKKYSSALEDHLNTTNGQLQRLKSGMQTFFTIIGGPLEQIITPLLRHLADFVQSLAKIAYGLVSSAKFQREWNKVLALGKDIVHNLGLDSSHTADMFRSYFVNSILLTIKVLQLMLTIINLVILGIKSLANALRFLSPLFKEMGDLIKMVLGWVKAFIDRLGALKNIHLDLADVIRGLIQPLKDLFTNLWAAAGGWDEIKAALDRLGLTDAWNKVSKFVSDVIAAFADFASQPLKDVGDFVKGVVDKVGELVGQGWDKAATFVGDIKDKFVKFMDDPVENTRKFVEGVVNKVRELVGKGWEDAKQFVEDVKDVFKDFAENPVKETKKLIQGVIDELTGKSDAVKKAAEESFGPDTLRGIRLQFGEGMTKDAFDDIVRGLQHEANVRPYIDLKLRLKATLDSIQDLAGEILSKARALLVGGEDIKVKIAVTPEIEMDASKWGMGEVATGDVTKGIVGKFTKLFGDLGRAIGDAMPKEAKIPDFASKIGEMVVGKDSLDLLASGKVFEGIGEAAFRGIEKVFIDLPLTMSRSPFKMLKGIKDGLKFVFIGAGEQSLAEIATGIESLPEAVITDLAAKFQVDIASLPAMIKMSSQDSIAEITDYLAKTPWGITKALMQSFGKEFDDLAPAMKEMATKALESAVAKKSIGMIFRTFLKDAIKGIAGFIIVDITGQIAIALLPLPDKIKEKLRTLWSITMWTAALYPIGVMIAGGLASALGIGLLANPVGAILVAAVLASIIVYHSKVYEIGQRFVGWIGEGIKAGIDRIGDFFDQIRDFTDKLGEISPALKIIADAVILLIAAFTTVELVAFGIALAGVIKTFIGWPAQIVVDAVSNLGDFVSVVGKMVSKSVKITQEIVRSGAEIIQSLPWLYAELKQTIVRAGEQLITDIATINGNIIQTVKRAGTAVITFLENVFGTIVQFVKRTGDKLIEKAENIQQTVTQQVIAPSEDQTKTLGKKMGASVGTGLASGGAGGMIGMLMAGEASIPVAGWIALGVTIAALIVAGLVIAFPEQTKKFAKDWGLVLLAALSLSVFAVFGALAIKFHEQLFNALSPYAIGHAVGYALGAAIFAAVIAIFGTFKLGQILVGLIAEGVAAAAGLVATAAVHLWDGLASGVPNLLQGIGSLISDFFTVTLPAIVSKDAWKNLFGWLIQGFLDLPDNINIALGNLIDMLNTWLGNLKDWFGGFAPWQWIEAAWEGLYNGIKGWLEKIHGSGLIDDWLDSLKSLFMDFFKPLEWIGDALKALLGGVAFTLQAIVGIVTGFPAMMGTTWLDIIKSIFLFPFTAANLGSWIANAIGDFFGWIVGGLTSIPATVFNAAAGIGTFIKDNLGSPDLFASKIADFFSWIAGGLLSIPKDVYDAAIDIGGKIVQGLWDGITGSPLDVLGKVKGWAGDIVHGIGDVFSIFSPPVTYDMGIQLVQGLQDGVDSKKAESLKTIADAFGSIMTSIQSALTFTSPEGTGISGLADYVNNTLAPDVETIVKAFADQGQKLEDAGGDWQKHAQNFGDAANSVFGSLKTATDTLSALGSDKGDIQKGMGADITSFVNFITQAVTVFGNAMTEGMSGKDGMLQKATDFSGGASAVLQSIGTGVDNIKKLGDLQTPMYSAVTTFTFFTVLAVNLMAMAGSLVKKDGLTAAKNFASAADDILADIGKGATSLAGLPDLASDTLTKMQTFIFDMVAAILMLQTLDKTSFIQNALPAALDIASKAADIMTKISEADTSFSGLSAKGDTIFSSATAFYNRIVQMVYSAIVTRNLIEGAGFSAFMGIRSDLQQLALFSFTSVGESIIDGIALGMEGHLNRFSNTARIIVNYIKQVIYSEISGGSPAKAFVPHGESIVDGMVVGILNRRKALAAAVKSAVSGATATAGALDVGLSATVAGGLQSANAGIGGGNAAPINISVSIPNSVITSQETANLLADVVSTEIVKQLRRSGVDYR